MKETHPERKVFGMRFCCVCKGLSELSIILFIDIKS